MKLRPMSDLHLAHHRDDGASFVDSIEVKDQEEILILAGDICNSQLSFLHKDRLCAKFQRSIFLRGNHEFYGQRFMSYAPFKKGRIIAATLWHGENESKEAEKYYNDFEKIVGYKEKVYDCHKETVEWLSNNIKEGDIVVTHHAPSLKSIPARFVGSQMNPFFANDLDKLIEMTKPALWIHGHIHDRLDYFIGKTRVVCNPLGYPHAPNSAFDENLVIEI